MSSRRSPTHGKLLVVAMSPIGVSLPKVEVLDAADLVAVAQCIAIDAATFPHPSATFGMRSRDRSVWVAREPPVREVLGYAATARRGLDCAIEGLAVDERRRRRGIARALLRTVVDAARAARAESVVLSTWVGNAPALGLYLSEGFAIRRRLSNYYPYAAFAGGPDAYELVHPLP